MSRKQVITLNESQLRQILKQSVRNIINESLKGKGAQKILKIASEHGGLDKKYHGVVWYNYLSEIPEDWVLGTGHVDLHIYPHKNFEINGVSDDDMDQIRCLDGTYIYYDKKRLWDFIEKDGRKKAREDNESPYKNLDGAFKYMGKYSNEIERKKDYWDLDGTTFRDSYWKEIRNIEAAKYDLGKLKDMGVITNLHDEVDAAIEALNGVISKLKEADDNRTDNLPNPHTASGHYWRVNQPSNVRKFMKARDSRIPNPNGISHMDVQRQGNPGYRDGSHSKYAHKGKYAYR